MNNYRLEWDEGKSADVYHTTELHGLLDRIELESKTEPQIVDLISPAGPVLNIGVGCAQSVVMFSASADSPYLVSMGDDTGNEIVVFRYHGDWSEFPRHYLVPSQRAREAMEQFFLTGECPDKVGWVEM